MADHLGAALTFPPEGVTGTSCYRFEYNLHLVKIPSHVIRESIYHRFVNVFIRVLNFRGWSQPRNYFNSEIFPICGNIMSQLSRLCVVCWHNFELSRGS